MTYRYDVSDDRVSIVDDCGVTVRYGRERFHYQSGDNRPPGETLDLPHSYQMYLYDVYHALAKEEFVLKDGCSPDPGCETFFSITPGAELIRPWDANDDIALYGKLKDKLDQHDFNAGISVGELGKTVDMIANRAKQLAQAGRFAKRGNLLMAARSLGITYRPPRKRKAERQSISDGWLELQYGWKPLLKDVYNLSEALRTLDKPRSARLQARHWIGKRASLAFPGTTGNDIVATGSGKWGKQIIAYVVEEKPPILDHLGLSNPGSIVWELVPFSFVADWIIPIGSYLEVRNLPSRMKGTFVLTSFDKHDIRMNSGQVASFGCVNVNLTSVGWAKHVSVYRTVTGVLPDVPLPTLRNPFTGINTRLANAVALVVSVFGRS